MPTNVMGSKVVKCQTYDVNTRGLVYRHNLGDIHVMNIDGVMPSPRLHGYLLE